jgi:hypothetical protein
MKLYSSLNGKKERQERVLDLIETVSEELLFFFSSFIIS